MDQTLVASIRKNLEDRPTEELRQAYESGDKAGSSPEELEAMRQLLEERRLKSTKFALAVASAILLGALGAAGAWWQVGDAIPVFVVGAVCASLGFAGWYINLS